MTKSNLSDPLGKSVIAKYSQKGRQTKDAQQRVGGFSVYNYLIQPLNNR